MAITVSRTSKRNDTWEPVTGRVLDANGPVDLTGATLRFLGKFTDEGIDTIIDSDSPAHGICINVEDEDGPGPDIDFEMPDGGFVNTPENRGVYRFEMEEDGVSIAGLYECELEATKDGKVLTFPSSKAANPGWQIDEDIA